MHELLISNLQCFKKVSKKQVVFLVLYAEATKIVHTWGQEWPWLKEWVDGWVVGWIHDG